MKLKQFFIALLVIYLFSSYSYSNDELPVSASLSNNSVGKSAGRAYFSVYRIICIDTNKTGTCFLHKSGKIITAAHIVDGSNNSSVFIVDSLGNKTKIKKIVSDIHLDLALITPETNFDDLSIPISLDHNFSIGAQVITWGYPSGYSGLLPMLSVGYYSGYNTVMSPKGKSINRWVINAAFNLGNSGGPLINTEDGKIIGVVSSKLAPIPDHIENALESLKNNKYGSQYTKSLPDGSKQQISEGQLIEEILQYLRSQTQLVIGHSVTLEDIRSFLISQGIDP